MSVIKDNLVLVISLAVLGVGATASALQASTKGWGVDNAPPPEERQRSVRSHRHGHYWIFYGHRRRSVRGGGAYGGGGFRGGK